MSKLYYAMGKGEMELTETVTANRLPDSFAAEYHHKNMDNTLVCRFTALDGDRTRYEAEGEYTAFRGVVPKLVATFMPGMFKKPALKWAIKARRPVLLDFIVSREENVFPMIPAGASVREIIGGLA